MPGNRYPRWCGTNSSRCSASIRTRGDSITAVVRGAAEDFLLSSAPVDGERRCGAYRLIRLLGNGGMGAVYLAERADGEVEQQVAIKFLRAGQDLPSFRSRFLRERQILASLNHPGSPACWMRATAPAILIW